MTARVTLAVLMAAFLLAACGVKGDPVPPKPEPERPTQQGTS